MVLGHFLNKKRWNSDYTWPASQTNSTCTSRAVIEATQILDIVRATEEFNESALPIPYPPLADNFFGLGVNSNTWAGSVLELGGYNGEDVFEDGVRPGSDLPLMGDFRFDPMPDAWILQ